MAASLADLEAEVERLRSERDAVIGLFIDEWSAANAQGRWSCEFNSKGENNTQGDWFTHPNRDSAVNAVRKAAGLKPGRTDR